MDWIKKVVVLTGYSKGFKRITLKHVLIPITISLILASFFSVALSARVKADSIASLSVYVQRGDSGTPTLVHTYSQAEMESLLMSSPQYYTGIDSMPAVVQGKGTGVLLSTLVNNLNAYDPGISFGSGASLKLTATDNYFKVLTYEYLFGAPRYYYPNLYIDQEGNNNDMSGAVAIDPMLCITSCQARFLMRTELDSQTMDTSYSYRFCFGLTPSEVGNTNPPDTFVATANKFVYRINRIDILLPSYSITVNSMSGGNVVTDKTSASSGETVSIHVTPDTGFRLAAGSLSAGCGGNTVSIMPVNDAAYTFTMPSGNVNINASFEPAVYTMFFTSNGVTYSFEHGQSGSEINEPDVPIREGYTFEGWYTNENYTTQVSFPCVLNRDQTLYAKWIEIKKYTVTVTLIGGEGNITVEPETVVSGESSVITVILEEEYCIATVTDDGEDVPELTGGTAYTVDNVTADHHILVVLVPRTWIISPEAGIGGKICPELPQTVNHGDMLKFTVTADTGYCIDTVEVDGKPVILNEDNSYTFPDISFDHSINATFIRNETEGTVTGNPNAEESVPASPSKSSDTETIAVTADISQESGSFTETDDTGRTKSFFTRCWIPVVAGMAVIVILLYFLKVIRRRKIDSDQDRTDRSL